MVLLRKKVFWLSLALVSFALAGLQIYRLLLARSSAVVTIEPDLGQRKVRYHVQAGTNYAQGQTLYNSLRGKVDYEVLSKAKLLPKPEMPIKGIRAETVSVAKKKGRNPKLKVSFKEGGPVGSPVPTRLYRLKVAPVRDLEEASKVWSSVKAKNPLFFNKFDFLLDKVSLPDGQVVHYLAMGDYESPAVARLICKKLEVAGYRALIYEVVR